MSDKEKLLLLADQIEMTDLPRVESDAAQEIKLIAITRLVQVAREIITWPKTFNPLASANGATVRRGDNIPTLPQRRAVFLNR